MTHLCKLFCGLLLGATAVTALQSCAPSLEDRVKMASGHCPVTIDNVGFINDIHLSGDTLVYDCTVTNPDINIAALSERPGDVKRVLAPQITGLFNDNRELLEQVTANNLILSVRYRGHDRSMLTVDFTPSELTEATSDNAHATPADPVARLSDEIKLSQASLPVDMADGIVMTAIDDSDMTVNFRCTVDEAVAGTDAIANLRDNRAQIRSMMLSSLRGSTDTDIRRLVEIATSANRGIAYRYTGNLSGDTMSVVFTPAELLAR